MPGRSSRGEGREPDIGGKEQVFKEREIVAALNVQLVSIRVYLGLPGIGHGCFALNYRSL